MSCNFLISASITAFSAVVSCGCGGKECGSFSIGQLNSNLTPLTISSISGSDVNFSQLDVNWLILPPRKDKASCFSSSIKIEGCIVGMDLTCSLGVVSTSSCVRAASAVSPRKQSSFWVFGPSPGGARSSCALKKASCFVCFSTARRPHQRLFCPAL